MTLNKLSPNLMVEDVNKTVEFYQDVLEFEFVVGVPENSKEFINSFPTSRTLDYALMRQGGVELMFQTRRSLEKDLPLMKEMPTGGSLTLYIKTENLKDLYSQLKGKVKIVKELHKTFYGMQEFYIQDCNGFILTFAQRV